MHTLAVQQESFQPGRAELVRRARIESRHIASQASQATSWVSQAAQWRQQTKISEKPQSRKRFQENTIFGFLIEVIGAVSVKMQELDITPTILGAVSLVLLLL